MAVESGDFVRVYVQENFSIFDSECAFHSIFSPSNIFRKVGNENEFLECCNAFIRKFIDRMLIQRTMGIIWLNSKSGISSFQKAINYI